MPSTSARYRVKKDEGGVVSRAGQTGHVIPLDDNPIPFGNDRTPQPTFNVPADVSQPQRSAGSTPMPSFTPGTSINPEYAQMDAQRAVVADEYDENDIEELNKTIDGLMVENTRLRNELANARRQVARDVGLGNVSASGITAEGVMKFLTGEQTESATMTIPTQGFVSAEMQQMEERIMTRVEEIREEMHQELKEISEVAAPILKFLQSVSK